MITPRNRLIFWTGLVLLPLSVLAALLPAYFDALATAGGSFLLIAALDALFCQRRLDNISAVFPEVVRLTREREGSIPIEISHPGGTIRRIRLGLALPSHIKSLKEYVDVILPDDSTVSRVSWPCTAYERGNYFIENIYLETRSALGFWAVRKRSESRAEVRVYPNTMREQKHLAALFLNRGLLGIHARRQVGKGKEFEKLREYIPGDSFEDIHWKATAKRGRPVTKVFQIERTQEVYVVIDASRLSGRKVFVPGASGGPEPAESETIQLERFITAAMVLGLVAERQGDLFGVLAFDDRVRSFVRARNGKAHYSACRDAIYTLTPGLVNPDFGELCSFIRLRLRKRALLMFLTNLDDPVLAESFNKNLELISRHHLVLVNMLAPPGVAPLFSSPDAAVADDLYKRLSGHIQWHKLRELEKQLKRQGVSMAMLKNEIMSPQLVTQYLEVKRRQLL